MIHPARIHRLNDKLVQRTGTFVVYWMQQSQRAEENHALEYAIIRANELHLPVAVVFGLMEKYPEATDRHVAFMLQGLEETFRTLERRGISAWIGRGNPAEVAIQTGKRAAVVVCDMGYLRHQAEWRARVAEEVGCEVVEVESDILVPVELASDHAEYMARTLRPKLRKRLDEFLQPVPEIPVVTRWPGDRQLAEGFVRDVPAIHSAHVLRFAGGTRAAKQRLRDFIKKSLPVYEAHSNQPQTDDTSVLSPYLHFGQISPVYIACEIQRVSPDSRFLEQLIIRRELSINFVWFTPDYDRFSCLPDWAR
ncbi:MAG: deoxyribodipyrimidine photolyase, partial [Kiritimatiellaceae bacterium]|nr:deoxyribodipyrimidine photolyase [Kiritimatiellaceae bacterium]